jgi:hypothetical protein
MLKWAKKIHSLYGTRRFNATGHYPEPVQSKTEKMYMQPLLSSVLRKLFKDGTLHLKLCIKNLFKKCAPIYAALTFADLRIFTKQAGHRMTWICSRPAYVFWRVHQLSCLPPIEEMKHNWGEWFYCYGNTGLRHDSHYVLGTYRNLSQCSNSWGNLKVNIGSNLKWE